MLHWLSILWLIQGILLLFLGTTPWTLFRLKKRNEFYRAFRYLTLFALLLSGQFFIQVLLPKQSLLASIPALLALPFLARFILHGKKLFLKKQQPFLDVLFYLSIATPLVVISSLLFLPNNQILGLFSLGFLFIIILLLFWFAAGLIHHNVKTLPTHTSPQKNYIQAGWALRLLAPVFSLLMAGKLLPAWCKTFWSPYYKPADPLLLFSLEPLILEEFVLSKVLHQKQIVLLEISSGLLILWFSVFILRALYQREKQEILHILEHIRAKARAHSFSEKKFRQFFTHSNDAVFLADAGTGVVVEANPRALVYTDQSYDQIIGTNIQKIICSQCNDQFSTIFGHTTPEEGKRLEGKNLSFECYIKSHRGIERFIELFTIRFSLENWPLVLILGHDITERKKFEEQLLEKQESLEKAQEIAHIGSWDWHIQKDTLRWSKEVFRIFAKNPEHHTPSYQSFLDTVHPDDRHKVQKHVNQALKNKNNPYKVQHRIIRPSGEERIVQEYGEVFRTDAGEPYRMVGAVHDITDRILAKKRLKNTSEALQEIESQLRLTTKIFENAIEGVSVTDIEGNIQSVNPAFTLITGYTAEEVIGKNPRVLKSDRHPESFYKNMWKEITEKGQWQGEIWNRRKNGEAYPEWLTINSIKDRHGNTTNYIAVFNDLTELRRTQEDLLFSTRNDALTGLPNREFFNDNLNVALQFSQQQDNRLAVAVLNLDHFKKVNDQFGLAQGDKVLQQVVQRLNMVCHKEDTLARLSGDEFAFIFRGFKSISHLSPRLSILEKVLTAAFTIKEQSIFITASIGIAFYPENGHTSEALLNNASTAMDRAQQSGGEQLQFYEPTMGKEARERIHLETDLRQAFENEEFVLYYQPKIDTISGEVRGMEALIRWIPPGKPPVSPGKFIPIVEESGLIIPLGLWILRTACQQTKRWLDAGHKGIRVAVNLSTRQFQQENFLESVQMILDETELPAHALELEITESMMMEDVNKTITLLQRFRNMGIHVAIDDFGTGHASLNYLKKLPVDCLKIDQSFIRYLHEDPTDVAITSSIINLAHRLGLSVVAEGVERSEHAYFLKKESCEYLQGYLISHPLPTEEFTGLLKNQLAFSFNGSD
ncbi:sensor domain-containing protein [Magnetococcales bacterium HHB-1]